MVVPTRRSAVGARNSGPTMPVACAASSQAATISGTSTRWPSPSPARNIGCGAPSTRMAMCSMRSSRPGATPRPPKRLLTRLLKKQGVTPERMITDKLRSYGAARRQVMPDVEHRAHKGLNNRAENSHVPPKFIVPPGRTSIPGKGDLHGGSEQERHAAEVALHGRMAWQRRRRLRKALKS
jgi:hypothetical protein